MFAEVSWFLVFNYPDKQIEPVTSHFWYVIKERRDRGTNQLINDRQVDAIRRYRSENRPPLPLSALLLNFNGITSVVSIGYSLRQNALIEVSVVEISA